jgi:arylsulfatase A
MKLHLYEGGIRVPGIVRWPGRTRPGTVCDEPINGTDVLPTLCDAAGVATPTDQPLDGASVLPALDGRPLERDVPLYWRYDRALSRPFTVAMRRGDWKILANNQMTRFDLYNLRSDLAERNDLADTQPERLEQMKQTLAKLHTQIDAEGPKWPQQG